MKSDPWIVKIEVEGKPVQFKIDTGADVTVIPSKFIEGPRVLQNPNRVLYGPGQYSLPVKGKFKAKLRAYVNGQEKLSQEEIYVVQGLIQALLGRQAVENLNLVTRSSVDEIKENPAREIQAKYPKLFSGLGKLQSNYTIQMKENATPFSLTTPRRVPLPLLPKVRDELRRMESLGVIKPINEPTEWCSGIVVVPKPNGRVRICVDLTKLNESVKREKHILPSTDRTLAQLAGAKVYSKLDANSGFWQVELSEESSRLTTFITPFGRYYFKRLPFGISSAPEHFQKRMSEILEGLEGVVCQMDDILVYGSDQTEHDRRLHAVLVKLQDSGITLNEEKCEFSKSEIKFIGHILNRDGIRPDPEKVSVIKNMERPSDVSGVRRLLGMTNQMGKFTPNLAEKTKAIRDLLNRGSHWCWGAAQEQAFQEIKLLLSSSPTLAHYDPNKDTVAAADASSFGLGAVITKFKRMELDDQ